MAIILTDNITPQQAWDRHAPVYNLRISRFGNDTTQTAGTSGDASRYVIPPSISLRGIAIAPDSVIPNALIDWRPAGLGPHLSAPPATFEPDGGRLLLTKDAPLLFPITGPIEILTWNRDLYANSFTALTGAVEPLGTGVGSVQSVDTLLSLLLFLRPPMSAYQGGSRAPLRRGWRLQTVPALATGDQIVNIVPVHGRKHIRWSFSTGAVEATFQLTGISGYPEAGIIPNSIREHLLTGTATGNTVGGHLTLDVDIDTQFVALHAVSAGAAINAQSQYEISDSR